MPDDEKKKDTIFTKLLKDLERRKKARRKLQEEKDKEGKRIETTQ